jgi:hypothetical protein
MAILNTWPSWKAGVEITLYHCSFCNCCGASESEASERSSSLICAVGSKKADF